MHVEFDVTPDRLAILDIELSHIQKEVARASAQILSTMSTETFVMLQEPIRGCDDIVVGRVIGRRPEER